MIRDDKNLEAEIENTFPMRICLSLIHSLSSIYSFTVFNKHLFNKLQALYRLLETWS